MPDVFKILKDLELRMVGLDETTNKMQEGYLASFRTVGLPIHKEDFENPYSPLGGHMAKDVPTIQPGDPKDAAKTASNQLTENMIAAAKVGASMQSYLNTFLLTDDKLRMNSQYAVMPDCGTVNDAWFAIITGANGIPMDSELNDAMKAAYEAANAVLMDKDGNPTQKYQSYLEYEQKHRDKVRDWQRAYAKAAGDPVAYSQWAIQGKSYHEDADEAMDQWNAFGHKIEIETALNKLTAQGMDPAMALISRAKKTYENSLLEFQSVGLIPYTIVLPNTWYDKDNDDGWTTYGSNDFHTESHYQASSTSYGGGGGFSVGFWSASGGFEHSESQSSMRTTTNDLEVSFDYCAVDIKRPWLDTGLLNMKTWFLMGDYKKACISNGTMAQMSPQSTVPTLFLPSITTSLILVKNLKISWSSAATDWAAMSSTDSAQVSIGWGPFAVHGNYSHHNEKRDFSANLDGQTLSVEGIQLLGYISMLTPLSPSRDSSEFMQKKDDKKTDAAGKVA